MREILYRGKRVDNGEWVEGFYVNCQYDDDENKTGHFILEYPNTKHEIYTDTVCQYTGLKDKNGRKIFEGDIMALDGWASAHSYEYPGEGDECTVRAEIIFHEGKFMPQLTAEHDDLELMEDAFEVYKGNIQGEVIGTKFDDCPYKKPDGLCLRESDSENNIYCVEGPCEELFGTKFDVEVEK